MAEIIYHRRCATDHPGTGDRERIASFERNFLNDVRESALDITVSVSFIHVVDGDEGKISSEARQGQIDALNEAYKPWGIQFSFVEADTREVDNAQFFTMGHKSAAERQCKKMNQAVQPQKGLNFYTASPGGGLLGWATFPFEMEGDPEMDGVVILYGTLPGGAVENYNLGRTAVHEVGHWLGLYHTFQDGCVGLGDEVSDTPAHSGPNFGNLPDSGQPYNLCPTEPAGALCPIHNYMNYTDDVCMTEFTPGQRTRIFAQLGLFRTDLLGGTQAEGLVAGAGRAQW